MVVSVTYHNHSNSFKNTCFTLLNMFKSRKKKNTKKYPPFPEKEITKTEGLLFFPFRLATNQRYCLRNDYGELGK